MLRRTLSRRRPLARLRQRPAGRASRVLRELGALLLEVHGQHETVGLLDAATHRPLLDAFGGLAAGDGRLRRDLEPLAGGAREGRSADRRRRPLGRRSRGARRAPGRARPARSARGRGDRAGRRAGAAGRRREDPGRHRRRGRSASAASALAQPPGPVAAGPGAGAGARGRRRRGRRGPGPAPDRRGDRGGRARAVRDHRGGVGDRRRRRGASISSPTGWRRSRSGCSPCAPWPASSACRSTTCRPRASSIADASARDRDRREEALAGGRGGRRRRPRRLPGRRRRRSPPPAAPPATASPRPSRPSLRPLKLDKARFRVAVEPAGRRPRRPVGRRPGAVRDRHQSRRAVRRRWAPSPRAASCPASRWR